METLGVYPIYDDVSLPTYSTPGSACFDIRAYIDAGTLVVYPSTTVMVPTGIIFNIPPGHSVRLHPRSGMASKQGLNLANCEGIIDSDYVEQVYIPIYNMSDSVKRVVHNDRICQGELVRDYRCTLRRLDEAPKRWPGENARAGGFGSTGTK